MKGTIEKIYETKQVSEKFKKREFVLKYADNPEYPEFVKMEFTQDKCNALEVFKVGDFVEVQYNLRGRPWVNPKGEEVFFNTVQAWKMDIAQQSGDITPERTQNDKYGDQGTMEQPPF